MLQILWFSKRSYVLLAKGREELVEWSSWRSPMVVEVSGDHSLLNFEPYHVSKREEKRGERERREGEREREREKRGEGREREDNQQFVTR